MYLNIIDVAYMSETNCHWKSQQYYSKLYKVVRKICERFHLTTSETKTPWSAIYKPRGTATITITNLSTHITSSGECLHELGRWFYTAFGSSNKAQLTIINDYRTCQQYINYGVSADHLQQYDIREERNQEIYTIRLKNDTEFNRINKRSTLT